jgi:DNA-binding CsgD family transcriptional regulator
VEFRHPLIRTAIYSGATTGRRQAAHAALARVFADAGDEDRRTWHLAAAAVEPDEAVAAQLERAAERARARGGPEAACAALERAAQLSTEPVPRKRRLVAAAENAWLAGQLDRASESLRAARPLAPEPQLDADIARLRGSIELAAGSATHAQQLLLRAAQDVADVDSVRALDILVVAAEAASYGADAAAAIEIGRLAARLPAQQNPRTEFLVPLLAGFGHVFAGDIGAATPLLRRGLQHAEEQEDDPLAAAGRAAMYVGDDAAALRLTARSVTRAREAGAIGYVVSCLQRLALLEIQAGRWSAATASAGEAVRLARETGQRDLSGLGAVWLALLAALRGDDGAFESAQALAEQATAEGPIRISVDELSWARGVRALGGGHPDSALSCFETIAHPVVRRLASLDAIEAAVQAGRPASAQSYLHRLEAFAEHTAAPWACAGVGHAHGLLAEGADAEEYFEEALVQHARSDRPFERGRTALAYGRLLRRARHRVAARTHLRSALDVFEGLGAGPWIEQARLELRASGETARRRDPSTVQQLTAQELQVARFVARGSSTRDVAAQLFLSPRTIDYHLRNVFAKLGISSRTELANVPLE